LIYQVSICSSVAGFMSLRMGDRGRNNTERCRVAGLERLLDNCESLPPVAQLAAVAEVLMRSGARLHDDLTMLVVG
jgi:hypothetical protein